MIEAADANKVYELLSRRYGHEYSITLIDGMIKVRKGWSMGADARMMSGGSMQGPDEKVFVSQRSYLDEHDSRIIKRTTGICAILGILGFWVVLGDVDTAHMSLREASLVNRSLFQVVFLGGAATGAIIGAITSVIVTVALNTRTQQAQNKAFVTSLRTFLNERLK